MSAVVLSWAIFYFTDFGRLQNFFRLIFGLSSSPLWHFEVGIKLQDHLFWLMAAILFCLPIDRFIRTKLYPRLSTTQLGIMNYSFVMVNAILLIISTALLVGKSYNPFLYFRF
jgi:alginate O-acetyltransferase complex protein AlgI